MTAIIDIMQHLTTSALAGAGGGLVSGFLRTLFNPVRSEDLDAIQKEISLLRVEIHRDFLSKRDIAPLVEDIRHIRSRLDDIADNR